MTCKCGVCLSVLFFILRIVYEQMVTNKKWFCLLALTKSDVNGIICSDCKCRPPNGFMDYKISIYLEWNFWHNENTSDNGIEYKLKQKQNKNHSVLHGFSIFVWCFHGQMKSGCQLAIKVEFDQICVFRVDAGVEQIKLKQKNGIHFFFQLQSYTDILFQRWPLIVSCWRDTTNKNYTNRKRISSRRWLDLPMAYRNGRIRVQQFTNGLR